MFAGYLEAQFTLWRLKYCLITIRNGHRASGVWKGVRQLVAEFPEVSKNHFCIGRKYLVGRRAITAAGHSR